MTADSALHLLSGAFTSAPADKARFPLSISLLLYEAPSQMCSEG